MSGSLEYWPTKQVRYGAPTRWERFRRFVVETPSAVLLIVQLAAIVVYPFLEPETLGRYASFSRTAFSIVSLGVLFVAVRAVRATPAMNIIAAVIGSPVVILTILEAMWPSNEVISFWSHLLTGAFYFYTGYGLVRYMFADNWVTKDELWATGATFTVLAWGYAHLFFALQYVFPNSFTVYGEALPGDRTWYQLLYMSVTTMTSLGMSDILAVEPHMRAFVLLCQISGMLYVALVVSRLVGLTIARFR